MYKLEPEIKLDKVLHLFKENYDYLSIIDLTKLMADKHSDYVPDAYEMTSIFIKLIDDGFIRSNTGNVIIEKLNAKFYIISINGLTFLNYPGGYVKRQALQDAESIKVAKLQHSQTDLQKTLNALTAIIAVGTLVAAVYYGIEVWKFFSCKR